MILPFPADEAFLHSEFTEFPQEGVGVAFSAGTHHFHYLVSEANGEKILIAQQAHGTRDGFYSLSTFVRWLLNLSRRDVPLIMVKGIVWKKEATLIPADLITDEGDIEKWYTLALGPTPERHTLLCPTQSFSGNRVAFPFPGEELNQLHSITSRVEITHPFSFRPPSGYLYNLNESLPDIIIELMPNDHQMFVRVWKSGNIILHNVYAGDTIEEIRYYLAGISHIAQAALDKSVYVYPGTEPDMMDKISKALASFKAIPGVVPLPRERSHDAPDGFNRELFADILQLAF